MKKMYALALGVSGLFLLSVNTGCKKSSNNEAPGSAGTVTASVAGQSFNAQYVSGLYSVSAATIELGGMQFSNGDTTSIALSIPDTLHVNVPYSVAGGPVVGWANMKTGAAFEANPLGGTGTVTLTAWDTTRHTIAGKFSGVLLSMANGTDTLAVANGAFSVKYTETN